MCACVKDEGAVGIPLPQTLSLERCCVGTVRAASWVGLLSGGVPPPPLLFFSRLGRNEYHGWEFKGQQTNQNISVYIDISLYISFIFMNFIYSFYLSIISSTTAGSKAYDSGIVCKCKMRAESLLPHDAAEKLKLKQQKI